MLEQFKVPDDIAVRVPEADMRRATEDVFCALGMSESDAAASADVLLYADIRGIDSHGVIRANFPAFTALIAQLLIDLRSLVPPVAGLVIQGGSTLNDSSCCQFHEVSFKNV